MLMHEVLADAASKYSDNIAFDAPDGTFTFTEFQDRVNRLAGALQKLGLKKGDRISILAPNCANYIAFHYATSTIGVLFHVLNTRHVVGEMSFMLNNAETSALILHEEFADKLDELKEVCPSIQFVVGIGDVPGADYSADELVEANYPLTPVTDIEIDHPILLIYTSGTTGRPKGALQTHKGSVYIDRITAAQFEATPDDVYYAFMPYFHQAGLIRTRAVLRNGGQSTMLAQQDPETVARFLIEKGVSITMLVPPYDGKLVEISERDGLSLDKLRLIVGGGGMGEAHAKRIEAFCKKANCSYMGIYGQTEVTGPSLGLFSEEYFKRPTSCGKAFPEAEVQIWEDGKEAPRGTIGEIMFRSPGCIPGYWRNEEATKNLFTGEWLHTGDLAIMDEDGYVHFMDRKKELIKTGGENVYPAEVTAVIGQHPDVVDLLILGAPDATWGEAVCAAIVLKPGATMTQEELKEFCKGKLAGYKIPKKMKVMDAIPRSFSGKPEKLKLKELFIDPVKETV